MLPSGTGTDPLNRDIADLALDELDVCLRIGRQVLVAGHAHGVGLPARKGGILDLDLVDNVGVGREGEGGAGAVGEDVGDANLDLVKVIQDIELGEVERGVVVDGVGVAGKDEIEPATATTTTGGHAEFPAHALQLVAVLVELFTGERSGSHSGGVRLQHTDDGLDAGWVEGKCLHGTT